MPTFQDKLYHYEVTPPEETWNNIADKLYNEEAIKLYKHGKPRLLFYGIAAAASIIIIFLASIFFNNSPSSTSNEYNLSISKDSIIQNKQILNSIINNPEEKKEIVSNNFDLGKTLKKYLTVTGPSGQPVKISPKVATLILYADNEYPPKPIWSDKICKWQEIMLNTTVPPTSANLLDMIITASKNNIE
jgi:hypothetical protein